MQDSAAAAALHRDQESHSQHKDTQSILDADGKLSSASAATSLKYAKPQDLPSFPSTGLQMSSAGAAASIAANNRKSFEHWKPGEIPAANKAALLAKDYEAKPLWHPEQSSAGSKAAMLAHQDVMAKRGTPAVDAREIPADIQKRALMAAQGAVNHQRTRSTSTPQQPVLSSSPDTSKWALKAATQSARDTPGEFAPGDPGFEAARVQHMAKGNVDRQLYGSNPQVGPDVADKNREAMLKASAVAMAKKMYAVQQGMIDDASRKNGPNTGLQAARGVNSSGMSDSGRSSGDLSRGTHEYVNLEEAARKLAAERLAKIYDEHDEYRQYYGQSSPKKSSRLSMRSSRPRASSAANAADADDSDEEDARKIRGQMSLFRGKLADVDSKKKQQDRDNLLQIAHKNVEARMTAMDSKVFEETGKASPAQMEVWQKSAREKAQRESDERMKYQGKVNIGGGKYLEQSEVEAIARARLQPTLDDITQKAEAQRAKDEAERAERERKAAEAEREKVREANTKAELKAAAAKDKADAKAAKQSEKDRVKQERGADKNRQREEKAGKTTTETPTAATSEPAPTSTTTTVPDAPRESTTTTSDVASSHEPIEKVTSSGDTFHDMVTGPTSQPTTVTTAPDAPDVERLHSNEMSRGTDKPTIEQSKTTSTAVPNSDARSSQVQDDLAAEPKDSRMKSWMKGRFGSKGDAQKSTSTGARAANADQGRASAGETDDLYGTTTSPTTADSTTPAAANTEPASAIPSSTRASMRPDLNRQVTPPAGGFDSTPTGGFTRHDGTRGSISSLSSDDEVDTFNIAGARRESARGSVEAPTVNTTHTGDTAHTDVSRGRAGFRERLKKRILPKKETTATNTTTGVTTTTTTTPIDKEKVTTIPVGGTTAADAPHSPNAGATTTDDEFEEAQDHFDEETLSPPATTATSAREVSPKAGRDGSKFTEQL